MKTTEKAIRGQVTELLPNLLYKVKISDRELLCYMSGKMKINKIRIIVGDWVEVIPDPYGGYATNRIIKRL